MFRIITLLAALLVLPSAAFAEWSSGSRAVAAGGSPVTSVGKGQCVFEPIYYTGQGSLLQAPLWPTLAQLNANIAGTQEGDVQVEIRRCVPGTASYSANYCQVTEYKNAAGAVVSSIDGDTSEGTDAIYGMRSPVFIANTTTYPTQVSGAVTAADTGTVTFVTSGTSTTADSGTADVASTTTLIVDTAKNWVDDQWNGYRARDTVQAETRDITDTDGTAESVTVSPAFTAQPDGNAYQIWDGTGTLTDTGQSWTTDEWAGFRVRNVTQGETRAIASNTATALTVSTAWSTAPAVGDSYQIWDGTGTLTATGETYTVDRWIGFRVTNTTNAETTTITDNTATQLIVSPAFTTENDPGDAFQIIDGTGTLTDTSENWTDDEWNGDRIRNTTTGEIRIVADTDGTLESVTVTNAWTTAPTVGDNYEILDITRTAELMICVDSN